MSSIIIIPTYNEVDNIASLVKRILNTTTFDVLVVDDASPDGTAEIVERFKNDRVHLLKRSGKFGLGTAYLSGFTWALNNDYLIIAQMDADFSHDPKDLPKMLKSLKEADLVIGSRYVKGGKIVGWNRWRHFCSRSAMTLTRLVLHLKVKDVTAGFRLWRASLLRQILKKEIISKGYVFQEELLFHAQRLKARIVEQPVMFKDRRKGKSKLGVKDIVEFFKVLYRLRHYDRTYE